MPDITCLLYEKMSNKQSINIFNFLVFPYQKTTTNCMQPTAKPKKLPPKIK